MVKRAPFNIKEAIGEQARTYHRFGSGLLEYFVYRNGRPRVGRPYEGEPGTPKECFRNATHLALPLDGSKPVGIYTEGLAIRPSLGIALHHAWVERSNKVIDPTWRDPEECLYMGVPFGMETLRSEIVRTGYYGLLCPSEMFNTDLMLRRDPGLVSLYPALERKVAA